MRVNALAGVFRFRSYGVGGGGLVGVIEPVTPPCSFGGKVSSLYTEANLCVGEYRGDFCQKSPGGG